MSVRVLAIVGWLLLFKFDYKNARDEFLAGVGGGESVATYTP